jgi:hypothetical protein
VFLDIEFSPAVAAPETGTLGLLVLAGMGVVAVRRRRTGYRNKKSRGGNPGSSLKA